MDALHRFLRRTLRPIMLQYVSSGLHTVAKVQQMRTPTLDRVMKWTAWSVSVEFYATFLPLLVWIGRWQLACRLTYLMMTCLYVGNALKDLLSIPRPFYLAQENVHAIQKVGSQKGSQKTDTEEYGLPSTHALNGLCFSLYTLVELNRIGYLVGKQLYIAIGGATAWVSLVCFGRVYLGMHCPADVMVGLLLGTCILPLWCIVDTWLVPWLVTSSHVVLYHVLLTSMLIAAYPQPVVHTPSFKYCMSFVGASLGLLFSVWSNNNGRLEGLWLDLNGESWSLVLLKRVAVGLGVTVLLKKASKNLGMLLLRPLCNVLESNAKVGKPAKGQRTSDTFVLVVHMSSYGVLGWSTFYFCPLLFDWFGM